MNDEIEMHWRTVVANELQADMLEFRQMILDEYGSFDHLEECDRCDGYVSGLGHAASMVAATAFRSAMNEARTKQIARELTDDLDEFLADQSGEGGIDHSDETRPE